MTANRNLEQNIGSFGRWVFGGLMVGTVAAIFWFFVGGGFGKKLELKIARDYIEEFEIAQRSGNYMDACIRAGFVANAFLEMHEEKLYRDWKEVEVSACKLAGL